MNIAIGRFISLTSGRCISLVKCFVAILVFTISALTSNVFGRSIDCIVVHSVSNPESIIFLDKAHTIVFENEQVVIGNMQFPNDDILRYEFANSSECGLTDIKGDLSDVAIYPEGFITFARVDDVESAHVYTVDGRECPTVRVGLTLDFSSEPAGVYIIYFATKSFKIVKR